MSSLYNAYEVMCFVDNSGKSVTNATAFHLDKLHYVVGDQSGVINLYEYGVVKSSQYDSVNFSLTFKRSKNLGLKKPISQLQLAAYKQVIIICDGVLAILSVPNLEPLYSASKIKSVTCFAVCSATEKSINLYVGNKKKTITLYVFADAKILCLKEIHLSEVPLSFACDGPILCVGSWSKYSLCNSDSGSVQELFSFEGSTPVRPIVVLVSKGEFLVNGVNNLGIFVSGTDGSSSKPPLQMDTNTLDLVACPPYVLSLSDEFVTVFNMMQHENQQIQTHGVRSGVALALSTDVPLSVDFGHFVLVGCSDGSVQTLIPFPWYYQVEQLLKDKRVSEAMNVIAYTRTIKDDKKDDLSTRLRTYKQMAGFICFETGNLEKAGQFFVEGRLDFRELISLFPNLLPSSSNFKPNSSSPPLHSIAKINDLYNESEVLVAKTFLLNFLTKYRNISVVKQQCQTEVDTALFKLTAELQPAEHLEVLIYSDLSLDTEDCVNFLSSINRYHSKALLLRWLNRHKEACDIWRQLLSNELTDTQFTGIDFFIEYLGTLEDSDLMWKQAQWVMDQNPTAAIKMFMNRSSSSNIKIDTIIDFLKKYPSSLLLFLEDLIFDKMSVEESHHTHLALLYLDCLELNLVDNKVTDSNKMRDKFKFLLESSEFYGVQRILHRVQKSKDVSLRYHLAVLYGKAGDAKRALDIFVHELGDYEGAMEFCKKSADPAVVFNHLIQVYLSPEHKQRMMTPAVKLLNSPDAPVYWQQVSDLLPPDWPIQSLQPFIAKSLRNSMFNAHITSLVKGLTTQRLRAIQLEKRPYACERVLIDDNSMCSVCTKPIEEVNFCLLASGAVSHIRCSAKVTT